MNAGIFSLVIGAGKNIEDRPKGKWFHAACTGTDEWPQQVPDLMTVLNLF